MSRRVAVVGGGPGGLFFATQLKRRDPDAQVTVFERNRPDDAFGFGVVFSDSTLGRIDEADPVLRDALAEHGTHWETIEVRLKGERHAFAGNGMAAIHRRMLLPLLHRLAIEAGVDVRFATPVDDIDALRRDYDVVVGADGANSRVRDSVIDDLGHRVETADARFIWFGTRHLFEGLTFVHRRSEYGNFAAHAYPISGELSTFIVETDAATWTAAGMDAFDVTQPPGPSDERTREFLAELFADDIDGAEIVANNSRWSQFRTRSSDRWHSGNVVLLGDAVHTAHFSVGSGTKMAMEDGIALADELVAGHPTLEAAFAAYEARRQPSVARIQAAARGGLGWWERFGFYHDALPPEQFAFHFFSRSIDIDRIEPRDPELVASARAAWRIRHDADACQTPLIAGDVSLGARALRLHGDELSDGRATVDLATGTVARVATTAQAPADLAGSALAVVEGGDIVARFHRSEDLRLGLGVPTVVVAEPGETIDVETAVLAGRADAVATRA